MFQGMEYVYEVYKERSFSRAARNLYISQPSLAPASAALKPGSALPFLTGVPLPSALQNVEKNISPV